MFEHTLTELVKQGAPNLLLSDFNYLSNKAINQFVNKKYYIYETTQQSTDDLRVLETSVKIQNVEQVIQDYYYDTEQKKGPNAATYSIVLPSNYLHLLNCECIYTIDKPIGCYERGMQVRKQAKKCTADSWSIISEDYYSRPCPTRPYYYFHNIENNVSQDSDESMSNKKADFKIHQDRVITMLNQQRDGLEKETSKENQSLARCEIRYGDDISSYQLTGVNITYIRKPKEIKLTQRDIDLVTDPTTPLEFPDSVCYQIIDELTTLIMENNSDQRLQTFNAVTQSIPNSAQKQTNPS